MQPGAKLPMPDVVTFGEALAMFSPLSSERLRYVRQFELRWGGAECNFAIALARLGISCGWQSLLGDDELGRMILQGARGEGVDVSQLKLVPDRPTGLYVKQFTAGATQVLYYRQGSAASTLSPDHLNEEFFASARWLHLTGITPALSPACRGAVESALEIAAAHGLTVSFDPNLRLKLWSVEAAREVLVPLMKRCDVLMAGDEELLLLLDLDDIEAAIEAVVSWNRPLLALKLGGAGALIATPDQRVAVSPIQVAQVVDPVGAGDGFDAGFAAGLLMGWDIERSARLGNFVGASAVVTRGDFEGYPSLSEAEAVLSGRPSVAR
jgi:2-dehydro-3-deoxygluconokinase